MNCKICFKDICIKCLDNYFLIEESNICQKEIPNEGYYYDSNSKSYKKCHEYCKTCSDGTKYNIDSLEIEDTNCDECIGNYFKIENTNNCVIKDNPPISYYFDEKKHLFCKCFEKCKTCNQNKINNTYFNCLTCYENYILYRKTANCLNCVARNQYVNYEQNGCIDFIPEGYYLLNEENKEIDKCYFSCKNCNKTGNSDDHKCIECGEDYPYKNKEGTKCLNDCSEEYLYTDIETKICYYDCKDNMITERIYNYKNICLSLEDKPDNYELVDYNNFVRICNYETDFFFNDECYDYCPDGTIEYKFNQTLNLCICEYLYYYDGEYEICIDDDECPDEYPFLNEYTLECSKYPFLYYNECYSVCPQFTNTEEYDNGTKICVDTPFESELFNDISIKLREIINYFENLKPSNNIVLNYPSGIVVNIYLSEMNIDEVEKSILSFIDLGECGKKIKKYYNLDSDEQLYIISVENTNNHLIV